MRPSTPKFNFSQQAGLSSPPETPTTTRFIFGNNRRHGIQNVSQVILQDGVLPDGHGSNFSYKPSGGLAELSPRSSTPSSDSSGSPPRSLSSDSREPITESSPRNVTRVVGESSAYFTVEEIRESDYDELDDEDDIIRPHQYEDAESDQARSTKGLEIDPRILYGFRDLGCEDEDPLAAHEAWKEQQRAEKRRKRRSSGSVQKRTLSQSFGSDTDDEDLQPVHVDANEADSSARRLRRKVGERTSLVFDDPPPKIPELDEPQSCEELVEEDDHMTDAQGVDRELPYYIQEMEVESADE